MDPLETASKRPHLVDVSELLINAESELFQNIIASHEFVSPGRLQFNSPPPAYKNGVPDKESILEVVSEQFKDRRVRHLKGACTDRSNMKDRLWNLAMFLALKTHLKPLECSYEDPDLTEAEKEFLNSEGVATPRPQDFANARIPSFEDEKLVDIFFMVSCSAFVINNFLLANWNTSELKQAILINWDITLCDETWDRHHGLNAIREASQSLRTGKVSSNCWYYYKSSERWDPNSVFATEFRSTDLPQIKGQFPDFKWCFQPSYLSKLSLAFENLCFLESQDDPKSLHDVNSFDDVTWNLDLIRDHYRQIGFTQEYLHDLETLLEGRTIRRIRILGSLADVDSLFIQRQLAFILNIKDHFGITEIISQEPEASDFDKGYLNSVGVATPPHDNCDQPEEGLGTTRLLSSTGSSFLLLSEAVSLRQMKTV
ncbi:hypothetical protein L596_008765 [Steinernema carpocapsae]|uniref:SRR1-like domain-containing protein n=1 Tax=Steinernema carpocapsae TaxID=34508 RepID=A0A4U5PDF9_STECR|nr:hypothetical protein L596_008765 [Steinernema carpocapsae]